MAGRDIFSTRARAYAGNSSFSKGEDLKRLMETIGTGPFSSALDLATGTGFTAFALSTVAEEVVALDFNVHMIGEADRLMTEADVRGVSLVIGSVDELPFGNSQFEVVTCRRAAHHFTDKGKFIREARRVLKQGGYFCVVDMTSPEGYSDEYNRIERARDNTHMTAEPRSVWEDLVEQNGFSIIVCEVKEEKIGFEEWLYPILPAEKEGIESRKLLLSSQAGFASAIGLGEDLGFIKRRMVLTARKN